MDSSLAKTLGQIILLQSTVHVIQDERELAHFVCRGLSNIQSVDPVGMFIRGTYYPGNGDPVIQDEDIKALFACLSDHRLSQHEHATCVSGFESGYRVTCLRIATGTDLYGFLFAGTDDEAIFQEIRPYIDNTLNLIALIIENNLQQDLLLAAKKDLEELVAERTRELMDANWKLLDKIAERKHADEEREKLQNQLLQAQKMESIGRLAGGVAHDFNNMLMAIIGNTEIAMEDTDPATPLYANLQEILTSAQRSADLTRQLLAFARKQAISPRVLELNEVVTGMIRMLQRLIGEDIDLIWKPGAALWPIRMDPSQIDQILVNLAVNARDAMAGVGSLTIQTDNIAFDETYCMTHADFIPGEYVMLAVSDTGCGVDPESLDQLFEPFFTTKEVGNGTGLGLATIYGIIKQNDGFINVYSEPGKGTIFRLYIPKSRSHGETESQQAPKKPASGTETVLLVEDEEPILKLGTAVLERFGYTVLSAHTPDEALRFAEQHPEPIHLLITDVIMPQMNGRDLWIQVAANRPEIKTLFMSGYTANVIAHHGVLEEGVHFIQKPFSIHTLAAKVRDVLDDAEA